MPVKLSKDGLSGLLLRSGSALSSSCRVQGGVGGSSGGKDGGRDASSVSPLVERVASSVSASASGVSIMRGLLLRLTRLIGAQATQGMLARRRQRPSARSANASARSANASASLRKVV